MSRDEDLVTLLIEMSVGHALHNDMQTHMYRVCKSNWEEWLHTVYTAQPVQHQLSGIVGCCLAQPPTCTAGGKRECGVRCC